MTSKTSPTYAIARSDDEWRKMLTPSQYEVLRRHGTEARGTSPLLREKGTGHYLCAGCGQALFSSEAKYESGSGWPSFFQALPDAVATSSDHKLLLPRVEVHCARCGGHLGHVFDDGPKPTGQRWCMNGAALVFEPNAGASGAEKD